jgi:hypothetical protein
LLFYGKTREQNYWSVYFNQLFEDYSSPDLSSKTFSCSLCRRNRRLAATPRPAKPVPNKSKVIGSGTGGVSDGETGGVMLGVTDGDSEGETDALGVADGVTLGDSDGVTLGVTEGVGVSSQISLSRSHLLMNKSPAGIAANPKTHHGKPPTRRAILSGGMSGQSQGPSSTTIPSTSS